MYIQKLVLGGQWSVVTFGLKRQKNIQKSQNFGIRYRFGSLYKRLDQSETGIRFASISHRTSTLYCGVLVLFKIFFIFCGYIGPIWPLNVFSPFMLLNNFTHRVTFSLNVTRCYYVAKNVATNAIGFSVRTVRAYIRACDIFFNVTLPSIALVKTV